eukprot:Hpha_TRINITY_DN8957_c0_g1::TRINITY_DN8957_c0_g1_i1::g.80710::m.80710
MEDVILARRWNWRYILLSFSIAVLGSNSALQIIRYAKTNVLRDRVVFLFGASLSLATSGIFGMHFVGMAAIQYHVDDVEYNVTYNPWMTFLSLIVPTVTSFLAFLLVSKQGKVDEGSFGSPRHGKHGSPRQYKMETKRIQVTVYNMDSDSEEESTTPVGSVLNVQRNLNAVKRAPNLRILLASIMVAVSVCVMHYIGMEAQELPVEFTKRLRWGTIIVSGVICETAAFLALHFAFVIPATRHYRIITACVMGVAVCVMHYTGMYGIDFILVEGRNARLVERDGWKSNTMKENVLISCVMWNMMIALVLTSYSEAREKATVAAKALVRADKKRLAKLLETYRTYLPARVLEAFEPDDVDEDADESGTELEVTGRTDAPNGERVTIVFTDIIQSTKLWERFPGVMTQALRVHDRVMRECIVLANGFEVKTIGDAFMVAFGTPDEACLFGLMVNEKLAEQAWPAELVSSKHADAAWNGIVVRIGVNEGPCEARTNPTTGRTDYYGTTVNLAARLEAASPHGFLTFTEQMFEAISASENGIDFGKLAVHKLGTRRLKGLSQPTVLIAVGSEKLDRHPSELAPIARDEDSSTRYGSVAADSPKSFSILPQTVGRSSILTGSTGLVSRGSVKGQLPSGTELQIDSGTCAAVRCCHARCGLEDRGAGKDLQRVLVNWILLISDVSARTQGSIDSVLGELAVLTWNVGQKCPQSVSRGAAFFGYLLPQAGTRWPGFVHGGLSAGPVLWGLVGSHLKRFATVSGHPFELSVFLSSVAEEAGIFCAVADSCSVVAHDPAIAPHVRPIDRFNISDPTGITEITVYQLNPSTVVETTVLYDGVSTWGSPAYLRAFEAAYEPEIVGDNDSRKRVRALQLLDELGSEVKGVQEKVHELSVNEQSAFEEKFDCAGLFSRKAMTIDLLQRIVADEQRDTLCGNCGGAARQRCSVCAFTTCGSCQDEEETSRCAPSHELQSITESNAVLQKSIRNARLGDHFVELPRRLEVDALHDSYSQHDLVDGCMSPKGKAQKGMKRSNSETRRRFSGLVKPSDGPRSDIQDLL